MKKLSPRTNVRLGRRCECGKERGYTKYRYKQKGQRCRATVAVAAVSKSESGKTTINLQYYIIEMNVLVAPASLVGNVVGGFCVAWRVQGKSESGKTTINLQYYIIEMNVLVASASVVGNVGIQNIDTNKKVNITEPRWRWRLLVGGVCVAWRVQGKSESGKTTINLQYYIIEMNVLVGAASVVRNVGIQNIDTNKKVNIAEPRWRWRLSVGGFCVAWRVQGKSESGKSTINILYYTVLTETGASWSPLPTIVPIPMDVMRWTYTGYLLPHTANRCPLDGRANSFAYYLSVELRLPSELAGWCFVKLYRTHAQLNTSTRTPLKIVSKPPSAGRKFLPAVGRTSMCNVLFNREASELYRASNPSVQRMDRRAAVNSVPFRPANCLILLYRQSLRIYAQEHTLVLAS
ncbi:hypothetical protein J6590_012888 [Homalodisca vitripennis]|nr:hypothetical protein J6590_012888 [Homalodisca vitripennis]